MLLKLINTESEFVSSIEDITNKDIDDLNLNESLALVLINPELYPYGDITAEDIIEVISSSIYEDDDGNYYTDDDVELPANEVYAVISNTLLTDDFYSEDENNEEE